jgi:hypothetical protein
MTSNLSLAKLVRLSSARLAHAGDDGLRCVSRRVLASLASVFANTTLQGFTRFLDSCPIRCVTNVDHETSGSKSREWNRNERLRASAHEVCESDPRGTARGAIATRNKRELCRLRYCRCDHEYSRSTRVGGKESDAHRGVRRSRRRRTATWSGRSRFSNTRERRGERDESTKISDRSRRRNPIST